MHFQHEIFIDDDLPKNKVREIINDTVDKDLDKILTEEAGEINDTNEPYINIKIRDKDGNIIDTKELTHLDISIFEYTYARDNCQEILDGRRDNVARAMYNANYSKYDICNTLKMTRNDLDKALNNKK